MILQGTNLPDPEEVKKTALEVKKLRDNIEKQKEEIVISTLSQGTTKAVEQAKEKGASSWLSTLPLEDQGFTLNKGEFRDALAIRYNADLHGLPD